MPKAQSSANKKAPFLLFVLALSCANAQEAKVAPSPREGYLAPAEVPDALRLLPPPPEPGTVAFARDQEVAAKSLALRGTPRWDQAIVDSQLDIEGIATFSAPLGITLSEANTPKTLYLFRRVRTDAAKSTLNAKKFYSRRRPFMENGGELCTPEIRNILERDGSYPSGHNTIGWIWTLLLIEIAPDRANELNERGREFGQSRSICNVHWQSDIDAGRFLAAVDVAALHAVPAFQQDFDAAKREIGTIRGEAANQANQPRIRASKESHGIQTEHR